MGGPLYVTFANIFLTKLENDVLPSKPIFYKRFVDDVIYRREARKPKNQIVYSTE